MKRRRPYLLVSRDLHAVLQLIFGITRKIICSAISGDTLFVGGCGRFFEGNPQLMHNALIEKLAKLPPTTVSSVPILTLGG